MAQCFVTVGTTRFDSLVHCLEQNAGEFCRELSERGIRRLVIQSGRSQFRRVRKLEQEAESFGIQLRTFPYVPSLEDLIRTSSLVISHAGAGTILEVCRAGKPLIVVVNERLMHNHQLELATALAARKHLIWSTVDQLLQMLQTAALDDLIPIEPPQPRRLAELIDSEMRREL